MNSTTQFGGGVSPDSPDDAPSSVNAEGGLQDMNFATQSLRVKDTNEVRFEQLGGERYLVAPVTAVREMVLKGELLTFDEIQRTAQAWNGTLITLNHPKEDGGHVPASVPKRFHKYGIGWMFNARAIPSTRKLDAEAWLNVRASEEVAQALDEENPVDVVQREGDDLEVSTGYWYDKEHDHGTFSGDDYSAKQTNVKPDHLAMLPSKIGECSVEDGCGITANCSCQECDDVTQENEDPEECECQGNGDEESETEQQSQEDEVGATTFEKFLDVLGLSSIESEEEFEEKVQEIQQTTQETQEEQNMEYDIENLAENTQFDEDALEAMEEDQLEALSETVETLESEEEEEQTTENEETKTETVETESADNEALKELTETVNSLADTVESNAKELSEVKETQNEVEQKLTAQEQEELDDLKTEVAAHSSFEKEELPDDKEHLETLRSEVKPRGGFGGASSSVNVGDKDGEDIALGLNEARKSGGD